MSKRNLSALSSSLAFYFGPAPVLAGEDSTAYDDLLARVSGQLKPKGIIEKIWIRDIVNLTWEILRYRLYKRALIKAAIPKALEETLAPFINGRQRFGSMNTWADGALQPTPAMELVNNWIRQDDKAIEQVNAILDSGKLTMEDVEARAFAAQMDKMQQFDRLISDAERRRNEVLREIERRRAQFSHDLRQPTDDVIEGDFETVGPRTTSIQN